MKCQKNDSGEVIFSLCDSKILTLFHKKITTTLKSLNVSPEGYLTFYVCPGCQKKKHINELMTG